MPRNSDRRLSLSATASVIAGAAVTAFAGISTIAGLLPAAAQPPSSVTVSGGVKPGSVARGGKGEVLVTLSIKPGWHVYAADPGNANYIPTTAAAKSANGVVYGKARFPRATALKTSVDPKPVNVYQGRAVIAIPFTVAKTASLGRHTLSASVGYQTCNDQTCLPPQTVPVTTTVVVK